MIISEIERQRFDAKWKVDPSGCWIWTAGVLVCGGYGAFRAGGKLHRAHRLSYELHVGPIPAGALMLHSCDTPRCINPAHLRPGTYSDNLRDCIEHGRANRARGERAPTAKLNESIVREIRVRCATERWRSLVRDLAREFGVTKHTIRAIATRRTWRHVQ